MAPLPRKEAFDLPEGIIYLDGNSLGPLPKHVPARMARVVIEEWGQDLIRGWNSAGWMAQPSRIGDRIGRLIGAPEGTVVVGDTLSIKVYQAVAAGLHLNPDRKIVLSDTGNFPSDLYMVEGLLRTMGQGHVLKTVPPQDVLSSIDDDVAVVLLTEVDYRSGRMHDMGTITRRAHDADAVMVWDLAHSAGAIPVDLAAHGAEMAVGCTYKYLNAGPGAPAFIYLRPDIAERVQPALSGWLGHRVPFEFSQRYEPGSGIERMRVGTPAVLQMAALDAALDLWDDVDMQTLRERSIDLQERFIQKIEERIPALELVSPRDSALRGSQVSFAFPHGYAAMQALIAEGVIGDFRAPDIMRFGITPLYLDESDIDAAVDAMERVLRDGLWNRPEYLEKKRVT